MDLIAKEEILEDAKRLIDELLTEKKRRDRLGGILLGDPNKLMTFLLHINGVSASEIADKLNLSKQAIYKYLRSFQKFGIIVDKDLTEIGEALLYSIVEINKAVEIVEHETVEKKFKEVALDAASHGGIGALTKDDLEQIIKKLED